MLSTVGLISYRRGLVGCRGSTSPDLFKLSIPGGGGAAGVTYQFIKYCHLTPPTKSTGEEGEFKKTGFRKTDKGFKNNIGYSHEDFEK